jgi:hypothetical protein
MPVAAVEAAEVVADLAGRAGWRSFAPEAAAGPAAADPLAASPGSRGDVDQAAELFSLGRAERGVHEGDSASRSG